jgi:hypothetical protein
MINQISQLHKEIEQMRHEFNVFKNLSETNMISKGKVEKEKLKVEDLPAEVKEYFSIIKSFKSLTGSKDYYMGKEISLFQKIGEHVDFSKRESEDAHHINKMIDDETNYDDKEYNILIGIEILLSENKIVEALNLIKWRKKILKLAQISGWNIASLISEKTLHKLGEKNIIKDILILIKNLLKN